MKNTYVTGYFPLLSIMAFSLSFSVYLTLRTILFLKSNGLFSGMAGFLSDTNIKLSFLLLFFICFFMLFAALKLLVDTFIELSLLFFSKDEIGEDLQKLRGASIIFLIGGLVSMLCSLSIWLLMGCFVLTALIAFIYFLNKISSSLSGSGLIGIIFFHVTVWVVLLLGICLSIFKLYNSIIAGLPL